jgi:hypothetical protein
MNALPGFDPVTGWMSVPLWSVGVAAALVAILCLVAIRRAGAGPTLASLAGAAVLAVGILMAWNFVDRAALRDRAEERRALDARMTALAVRALAPGSALACVEATAGDTVEDACERAVFSSPEGIAAAVAYVSARLALLAHGAHYAAREDSSYDAALADLRRQIEADPYGIVAHLLAVRDDCSAEQCAAFALLRDPGRIAANLRQRTFDALVGRHAAAWGPGSQGSAPVAGGAPSAGSNPSTLNFPSAASIPPVSIMDPEPTGAVPPRAGAAAPAAEAGNATPGSRRPPPASQTPAAAGPVQLAPLAPPTASTGGSARTQ